MAANGSTFNFYLSCDVNLQARCYNTTAQLGARAGAELIALCSITLRRDTYITELVLLPCLDPRSLMSDCRQVIVAPSEHATTAPNTYAGICAFLSHLATSGQNQGGRTARQVAAKARAARRRAQLPSHSGACCCSAFGRQALASDMRLLKLQSQPLFTSRHAAVTVLVVSHYSAADQQCGLGAPTGVMANC